MPDLLEPPILSAPNTSEDGPAAAGHIPLNRMDRKSQVQCLGDCRTMLAKGASVLFFPEGTRSLDARLGAFKKGAFSVAAKAKVNKHTAKQDTAGCLARVAGIQTAHQSRRLCVGSSAVRLLTSPQARHAICSTRIMQAQARNLCGREAPVGACHATRVLYHGGTRSAAALKP